MNFGAADHHGNTALHYATGYGRVEATRALLDGGSNTGAMNDTGKRSIDLAKMNEVRARIEDIVSDPRTAEALKPWYRQFCKRPTFNDDYLPAFNRANVALIDTQGRGLDRFTESGFVFDGREYPVDCVIFATGFDFGNAYGARAQQKGHPIFGRGGASLADEWQAGLRTLHGFYSTGFPNLFHMGGSQNGVAFAITYCLDEQAEHIAEVLKTADDRGATRVEPTPAAEAGWVATIRAKDKGFRDFQRECTPGLYNDEGREELALWLCPPFDGAPASPGNGVMVAFTAATRAQVDAFHAAALAAGGTSEGEPGVRPQYNADFYAAYVRDPDGNKLAAVHRDVVLWAQEREMERVLRPAACALRAADAPGAVRLRPEHLAALRSRHLAVVDAAIPAEWVEACLAEAEALDAAGSLQPPAMHRALGDRRDRLCALASDGGRDPADAPLARLCARLRLRGRASRQPPLPRRLHAV